MKKQIWKMAAFGMAAMTCVALGACGSDDDDNGGGGSGSTSSGVIKTSDGNLRISQVGNVHYYYDDKGRLERISNSGDSYYFSYSPNTIGGFEDADNVSVSYNGSGYITKLSVNYTYTDDDEQGTIKGSVSFSYDGSGHLTSVSGSSTESGTDKYGKFSESSNFSYTLKWSSGLLLNGNYKWTEKWTDSDGSTTNDIDTGIYEFEYDNDNYKNAYLQWTPGMSDVLDEIIDAPEFAYVGLYGKGPQYLPTSCTVQETSVENGREYNDNDSYSYRYTFNEDGTVYCAYKGNKSYQFSYTFASDTRAAAWQPQTEAQKVNRLRSLLRLRHRSKTGALQ